MEVKTKFSIGDKVWYISNNKVQSLQVTGVEILLEEDKEPDIIYILHFDVEYHESKVFASKEELLKSL